MTATKEPPPLNPEVVEDEGDEICPECPHLIKLHRDDGGDGVLCCSKCDCKIEVDEEDDEFDDDEEDDDEEDDDEEDDDEEDDLIL